MSGRRASFYFHCRACGRCCGEYKIVLSPYDIIRLRKATGCSSTELIRRGIVKVTRASFKKVFGLAPVVDMLEVFGFPENDTVPVATLAFPGKVSDSIECGFLLAEKDGKRLCEIYENRPGMCRLYPLGCISIGKRRTWFLRRPLCETIGGAEQTVDQWIRTSRVRPFLAAGTRYLRWMRELLDENAKICQQLPTTNGEYSNEYYTTLIPVMCRQSPCFLGERRHAARKRIVGTGAPAPH
ncbi:MAG: YkgJ family cysteine cluster protein [Candidatus Hydrogenedentota bacterium]|nr:MAG: YkgJ family cysteine cluster protein [Candidatus Hydrogenedentota bacterium]